MVFHYGDGSLNDSPDLRVISAVAGLRDGDSILANYNFASYDFDESNNRLESIAILEPPIESFINDEERLIVVRVRSAVFFGEINSFFAQARDEIRKRVKLNELNNFIDDSSIVFLPTTLTNDDRLYVDYWFSVINEIIERDVLSFTVSSYRSAYQRFHNMIERATRTKFNWQMLDLLYDGRSSDRLLSSEFLFMIIDHLVNDGELEFTRDWGELTIRSSPSLLTLAEKNSTDHVKSISKLNHFIPSEPFVVLSTELDDGIVVVGRDDDLDMLADVISPFETHTFKGRVVDIKNRIIYGKNKRPLKPLTRNGKQLFNIDGRRYSIDEIVRSCKRSFSLD